MDLIVQTIVAVAQAIMENPVSAAFVASLIRNASGWIQKRLMGETYPGEKYDPKILGATILKYEIAVNAISTVLPVTYATPIVLIADIVFSAAKKMKKEYSG